MRRSSFFANSLPILTRARSEESPPTGTPATSTPAAIGRRGGPAPGAAAPMAAAAAAAARIASRTRLTRGMVRILLSSRKAWVPDPVRPRTARSSASEVQHSGGDGRVLGRADPGAGAVAALLVRGRAVGASGLQ